MSFNAHKSRTHGSDLDFSDNVVSTEKVAVPATADFDEERSLGEPEDVPAHPEDEICETSLLEAQLHKKLASLFLKMQAILHVSESLSRYCCSSEGDFFYLSLS